MALYQDPIIIDPHGKLSQFEIISNLPDVLKHYQLHSSKNNATLEEQLSNVNPMNDTTPYHENIQQEYIAEEHYPALKENVSSRFYDEGCCWIK